MLYQEREDFIKKELQLKTIVKTHELMRDMNISIDTVRRDLKKMEEDGLLKCVRGGATSIDQSTTIATAPFDEREIVHVVNKRIAAKKAISYIKEGYTVALNSGTTNVILASEMLHIQFPFTVITNNLSVITILSKVPHITLIGIGGFLDKVENSFYGKSCENEFKQYNPDISFLSINAVSIENGFSDFRYNDFPIINVLKKRSDYCIAIMDSSKFGKKSKKNIFKISEIDLLISDDSINNSQKDLFKEHGIQII